MTGCKHSAITFLSDQLCLLGIHDKREYIANNNSENAFAEYSQHNHQIIAQRQLFRKGYHQSYQYLCDFNP